MKTLLLALLALPASMPATKPASTEFRIELFSRRPVKAFVLEAAGRNVSICGSKADGPCLPLPLSEKMSCIADRVLHCGLNAVRRDFTLLSVDAPVRLESSLVVPGAAPQSLLLPNVRVTVTSAGSRIVTRVDLESYVSDVLSGEASVLQVAAARRAMAILVRTWALRWQGRHREAGFDFCSLTHCQVFRPSPAGKAGAAISLDPAALATRGQLLKYHGELADPYFTACCGGLTEAAGNVWPDCAQPYLSSIHDPYCLTNSHASWNKTLAGDRVEQVLREALRLPISAPLADLSVENRDSSGRALVLRIVAGGTWNVDANQFRFAVDRLLGWEQIKSNLYTLERRGDSWTFSGHGLGHGVGLCQAGAEQMARLGFSAESILSTYFPGTEIGLQNPNDADPVATSEHFELVYPNSQEPWVGQTLKTLELWRAGLGVHAEALPPRVRVETSSTTRDFIRATGEPGWVAATSDGQSMALQPLQLLARRRILDQTLRHELTHLVVHRLSANGVPRWLEEGWVLYLTGERIEAPPTAFITARELDDAITKSRSETEMKTAYAQALSRVRALVRRRGEAAVWRLFEHPSPENLPRLGDHP